MGTAWRRAMISPIAQPAARNRRSDDLNRRGMLVLLAAWLVPFMPAQAAYATAFDLDEYAGKVVVLDFWASWCVPCRRSFPWLNMMNRKYAQEDLVIIGVNLDMERREAERFLEEFPADFTIVYDEEMALARRFGVMAMPSSFVIGRDGEVVAEHLGFKVKRQDEYEALIREALGIAETHR